MWKIPSFFSESKNIFSVSFSIDSHKPGIRKLFFCRETANENQQFKETKTLISNSYLIRQTGADTGFKCGGCWIYLTKKSRLR